MKAFMKQLASNRSFFWRYFFLLFMFFAMFFIALSLSTNKTVQIHQDYYLNQAKQTFQANAATLSSDFLQIHSLISAVEDSDNYMMITFPKKPFTYAQYYYTGRVRDFFLSQCNLMNLVEDGFIYFRNSDFCVTKYNFFESLDDCLNQYLKYNASELTVSQSSLNHWLSCITSKNKLYPFPVCDIEIKNQSATPCLTILVQPTAGRQIYGFLYSADTILNAFNIHTLPEDTYFKLLSSDQILYSYNAEKEDKETEYITFTTQIPSISSTAIIGIPKSHFDELTLDAQRSAQKLLLLSAFIGLILCTCFSYIGVKPLHSLMRTHDLSRPESRNEIAAIDNFIKQNIQSKLVLQNMLLSSVLTRTFHGLPVKKSEAETLTRDFPIFQKSLQLAIVREQNSDPDPEMHNLIFDFLRSKLPDETICEHINMTDLCIIFRNEIVSFEALQRILLEINGQLKDRPNVVAGVSGSFTGVEAISTAVHQAQISIPTEGGRIAALYTEVTPSSLHNTASTAFDLKRLQQELNSWNEKESLEIMEAYTESLPASMQMYPEEIFYNILYLLRNAAQSVELSLDAFSDTRYHRNMTPSANMQALLHITQDLFAQKARLQSSEVQQLSTDLVEFTKSHYTDPALSLATLAQEFCISERFAHKAIIALTGTSFNKFLLNIRMQEAARLFQETDESISSVSELVGCPAISTFYRNFKNYYHKTPAEYKEMFSENPH